MFTALYTKIEFMSTGAERDVGKYVVLHNYVGTYVVASTYIHSVCT